MIRALAAVAKGSELDLTLFDSESKIVEAIMKRLKE